MQPHAPCRRALATAVLHCALSLGLVPVALASATTPYAYVSPAPGSHHVSPLNNVAIRDGRALDPASVAPGIVTVVGTASGPHDGDLRLARDGRTLVFLPAAPFAAGETVDVTLASGLRTADGSALPPAAFTFEVASATPRELAARFPAETEGGEMGATPTQPSSDAGVAATCADLPTGFPPFTIRAWNDPDPGYLVLSPTGASRTGSITVIDNTGQPLFYQRFGSTVFNFEVQPNGLLTYFESAPPTGDPKFFALDHTFTLVDSFATGNGYETDTHELLLLPDGHFIVMAYDPQPVRMDLVVPGGNPDAVVTGLIVQELDADRNVVFQWRSWDHYDITDITLGSLTAASVDYAHGNAIELPPDGTLLLSQRNMGELTKIDRVTGDVLWRMGPHAKKNQFTFVNDPRGFTAQHDARWLPNGHLTVFDNGNGLNPAYSRFVEYAVDEASRTATEVREYVHAPAIVASTQGAARREPTGRTLIGWGGATSNAKLTEINPDGSVSLELGTTPTVQSYRVHRTSWRGDVLVTDPTFDCGAANPGATVERSLTVRNGTSAPVTIGCAVSTDPQFVVTTPFPLTLTPGGEAAISIAFTPSATGPRTGKIYLRAPNATQFIAQDVALTGTGNRPPDCSAALADPGLLWPPDHRLVPVSITGVVDPDGDPVTITVTRILQSEPVDSVGDGTTCPDAVVDAGGARLRAERAAHGTGRVYQVEFTAADPAGATCNGVVSVFVPHDAAAPASTLASGRGDGNDAPDGRGHRRLVDSSGPCRDAATLEPDADAEAAAAVAPAWTVSLASLGAAGHRATVAYTLAADGDARLAVYDLGGRRVVTLRDGRDTAGPHQVDWNTSALSPGIYFYRLRAGAVARSSIVRVVR